MKGPLYPIRNAASAHLLYPGVKTVSASDDALAKVELGPVVGIPGAPDKIPDAKKIKNARLTSCVANDGLLWTGVNLGTTKPAGEDGAGRVVALTFSFAFPDLFYLGFLAVDARTRGAGYGTRILTHVAQRYPGIPQLLEIEPVTREAPNYQQRVRRLAFYERNGFTVTNMLTHEADQTYRVLARGGVVSPGRLEEALNSATDDPAYFSRVTIG